MGFNFSEHPHRRRNPLTGEYVLVSPHRTQRPWQGKVEKPPLDEKPKYDPNCYLCPGNSRAGGKKNPQYKETFVFTNDFSALLEDVPQFDMKQNGLMRYEDVRGTCRVICFSPRHDKSLPLMSVNEIKNVINVWADQVSELSKKYRWIQVFENKGEIMGCSNPHPHGQIWAGTMLPNEPYKEEKNQKSHFERVKSVLLLDYLELELREKERIILENENWVFLVPFWALWPFETLLVPKSHVRHLPELSEKQRVDLAFILKDMLTKYDNLFNVSFPYSMGWHGHPFNNGDKNHWQLHAHFYPPLLRSATVKKFMVGYEMLSEPGRDITAERAADELRKVSTIHYTLD